MLNEQSGVRKLGAVLYLKSFAPIPIKRFVSCFGEKGPGRHMKWRVKNQPLHV